MSDKIHESVQAYYGLTLASTADLKTNACCTLQKMPKHIASALKNVANEVQDKYYGCGLCIPQKLAGLRLLDLGSGSGRDAYIAAQLVGEKGSVVGVDMTVEQIAVANKYIEPQRAAFGYGQSNVEFLLGNIENLGALPLEADSFDLIISNCVLNLAADKLAVLKQAFR
jgi:ubiquinone/menaquinone biosynthesis C-methylase UbiE